jgi:DNA invertase Pin-like site-specific DNA recombinase
LYVRQSTLHQVVENQESTRRQYALKERAMALGWPPDQIVVIDSDLGRSAASAVDREGFQKLVADVGMGRVGVVVGLEVSRLARNSVDWHRLLELCALTDTLILDEDGLYNPSQYNDRLLLGLKGTMSEAELHMLRARLRGGALSKAQRGEFRLKLPVGLVYDEEDHVVLHPDLQVRDAIRLFFKTYSRVGTACGVVKYYKEQGWLFPKPNGLMNTKEVIWGRLDLRTREKITTGFWSGCINSNGIARRLHAASMKASRSLLELRFHSKNSAFIFPRALTIGHPVALC